MRVTRPRRRQRNKKKLRRTNKHKNERNSGTNKKQLCQVVEFDFKILSAFIYYGWCKAVFFFKDNTPYVVVYVRIGRDFGHITFMMICRGKLSSMFGHKQVPHNATYNFSNSQGTINDIATKYAYIHRRAELKSSWVHFNALLTSSYPLGWQSTAQKKIPTYLSSNWLVYFPIKNIWARRAPRTDGT